MARSEAASKNDSLRDQLVEQGAKGDIAAIFQLQAMDVQTGAAEKGVESGWLKKIKIMAADGSLDAAYALWTELTTGTQFGILNLIEARRYLERAANGGHAGAISDLQEQHKLFEFWQRGADAGSGLFAFNLYEAYTTGQFGQIGSVLAEQYLQRSAQLNFKLAQKQLKKNDAVTRSNKK